MQTEKIIEIFCENVKILRKRHGLSQKEMAERLHIGTRSLALLEKGKMPPRLNAEILIWIYRNFGILPSAILSGKHLFDE